MIKISSWEIFQQHYLVLPELGISLDTSQMNSPKVLPNSMEILFQHAFQQMQKLEKGSLANPDENQMVGHYWLRDCELAPSEEIKNLIKVTQKNILQFTNKIQENKIVPQDADSFQNVLLLGIGGSALGPQFVLNSLTSKVDRMSFYFLDNTDPDGIDQVLSEIGETLNATLTLVISKSGCTKETRNAMLEVRHHYENYGLDFNRHAVAVTGEKSPLDKLAKKENWLQRFPMWDWIGGRTSVLSTVGMLPAALQGLDIAEILSGAKVMDELTRLKDVRKNPAAMLAWMWHHAGAGKGKKAMVMLPYKDRLLLFSRYLQQLVMESLGKEKDLEGETVQQGLSVYGNKGSTDQHAFVQQLREGPADFFVTFIEVLKERKYAGIEVEPGITSGDFLQGFMLGTSAALFQNGRQSLTITLEEINPKSLGALIALFERAVGLYASLIGINAYHQPGVEAGKLAAGGVLELSLKIQSQLKYYPEKLFSAVSLAEMLGEQAKTVTIFKLLEHLAANGRIKKISASTPFSAEFKANP